MPEEIFPSSYRCDCGHESNFSERTVRGMKRMSRKKEVRLADSAPDEHVIVFYGGEMVEIRCPQQPRHQSTKQSPTKRKSSKKRPAKKGIPDEVKKQVAEIVERFHAAEIRNPDCLYFPRYRGKFLYLDREDNGRRHPIFRLEYTGNMENWYFAIYKYSDEHYDEDEIFFTGAEQVDGTIEGTMRAGLEAYPY